MPNRFSPLRRQVLAGLGAAGASSALLPRSVSAAPAAVPARESGARFQASIDRGEPIRLDGRDRLAAPLRVPPGATVRIIAGPGARLEGVSQTGTTLFTGPAYSVRIEGEPVFANCRTVFHMGAGASAGTFDWDLAGARFVDFGYAAILLDRQGGPARIGRLDLSRTYFSARASGGNRFPFDLLQSRDGPPIGLLVADGAVFENGGAESLRLNSGRNGGVRLTRSRWSEYVNPGRGRDPDAHFVFVRSGTNVISDCRFSGLRPRDRSVSMNDSEGLRGGGDSLLVERCVFEDAGGAEAALALKGCGRATIADTTVRFTPRHVAAIAASAGARKDCSGILAPVDALTLRNVRLSGGSGAALDFQGNAQNVTVRGDITLEDWSTNRARGGRTYYSSGSAIRLAGRGHDVDLSVACIGPGLPRFVLSHEGGGSRRIALSGQLAASTSPGSSILFLNYGAAIDTLQIDAEMSGTDGKLFASSKQPTVEEFVLRGRIDRGDPRGNALALGLTDRVTRAADIDVVLSGVGRATVPLPAGVRIREAGGMQQARGNLIAGADARRMTTRFAVSR